MASAPTKPLAASGSAAGSACTEKKSAVEPIARSASGVSRFQSFTSLALGTAFMATARAAPFTNQSGRPRPASDPAASCSAIMSSTLASSGGVAGNTTAP